jgi:predicted PurR-regulated permease PerM
MVLAVAIAILAFLFLWFEFHLLLLIFAGLLIAVILQAITRWVAAHTPLRGMLAYAATLLLLGGLVIGLVWFLAPRVQNQLTELVHSLPDSIHRVEDLFNRSSAGHAIVERAHRTIDTGDLSTKLPELAGTLSGAVTDLIIIVVMGFFTAMNPKGYEEAFLLLLPAPRRARAREIAGSLQHQLTGWLIGQMVPMAVLGLASGLALWLLHVPLPWTLGLLTGLAVFLPYAGTVMAGIPAVLMGLERSPQTALWVLLIYSLLHIAEGYVLTPLVQRRAVRLPPVLTIVAQYFLWSAGGILGLALAAPLAGAGMVLVKQLYLHVPVDQPVVTHPSPD